MSSRFKALYLSPTGDILIRTVPEPYTPTNSQTLIGVSYSAIKVGDYRHFHMGMSDFVMGYDFVGTVVATGPSSPFAPGKKVLGMTPVGDRRPLHQGAHQAYLMIEGETPYLAWEKPDDLDELDAVGMVSAALTAADALFNVLGIGFPAAGVEGEEASGKAVLIWGGASAVGWAAVQLAREAGFGMVIVTASPKNHEKLREVGATQCFDYNSPTVVEEIREAVEGEGCRLTMAFDTVAKGLGIFEGLGEEEMKVVEGKYEMSTPAMVKRCLSTLEEGERYRLASTLPLLKDKDWEFALYSRKHGNEEVVHPGWWQRQEKVVTWLIENLKTAWRPLPKTRLVRKAEEAVVAVREVFEGKVSMEKVIIQHPMS